MEKKEKIKLLLSILMILWILAVFLFSSQDGTSSKNTSGVFVKIAMYFQENILKINNELSYNDRYDITEYIIRKYAHYTLYLIGGVLVTSNILIRVLEEKNKIKKHIKDKIDIIGYSIIISVIFAMLDEIHQAFSEARTPKITDVSIDTLGAITGILFVMIIYIKKINDKSKEVKKGECK